MGAVRSCLVLTKRPGKPSPTWASLRKEKLTKASLTGLGMSLLQGLYTEMDFRNEALNMQRMADLLASRWDAPLSFSLPCA